MEMDRSNKKAELEQENYKRQVYAFYKEMNDMEFQMAIGICNCILGYSGNKKAGQTLHDMLEIYKHIERQIQNHLDTPHLVPVTGKGTQPMENWNHFKVYCLNQIHLKKGETDKLIIIEQNATGEYEFPF